KAVTGLAITDGSIDWPQVAVTSATWAVNGGGTTACSVSADANVNCSVGNVAASSSVEVLIHVTLAATPDEACLNPTGSGTLDSTIRNSADAAWSDSDGGP